jgi:hypothetical protein
MHKDSLQAFYYLMCIFDAIKFQGFIVSLNDGKESNKDWCINLWRR